MLGYSLGSNKCCDLKGKGTKGATGPTGPRGSIGPIGATFNSTSAILSVTSNAVQTFSGSGLIATLFTVSASNVGTQFIITNTNTLNALTVIGNGTQLIYSTGAASAISRSLATGNSQIFTAIQTGAAAYGWSMV